MSLIEDERCTGTCMHHRDIETVSYKTVDIPVSEVIDVINDGYLLPKTEKRVLDVMVRMPKSLAQKIVNETITDSVRAKLGKRINEKQRI